MDKLSYHRHRYPSIVIQQAIWLYFRFALSYRDVEDMLAERRYRRVLRDGPPLGFEVRRHHCPQAETRTASPGRAWHLDEVFVSINGRQLYVWRAVDSEGEVLDILVQPRRDRKAALKLMRKLLKKHGVAPATIVTDKLGSYCSALRQLGIAQRHDTGRWKNNRAENSHQPLRQRERRMKRFKSPRIGTALYSDPCRRLQCVQRPTPSDLAPDPALISCSGYADLAPRDSRRVNRCGHGSFRLPIPLNVTVPNKGWLKLLLVGAFSLRVRQFLHTLERPSRCGGGLCS